MCITCYRCHHLPMLAQLESQQQREVPPHRRLPHRRELSGNVVTRHEHIQYQRAVVATITLYYSTVSAYECRQVHATIVTGAAHSLGNTTRPGGEMGNPSEQQGEICSARKQTCIGTSTYLLRFSAREPDGGPAARGCYVAGSLHN